MRLQELIEKMAQEKGKGAFTPENIEAQIAAFLPDVLMKSETLQIAFEISDDQMEAFYGEAYRFYEEEEYVESANAFRWLVLFNPFVSRYWMGLGASHQLLQSYEKALHNYAVAAMLDSLSPYPHLYAHDCLLALDKHEDAAKALELAEERARYDLKYVALKNEIASLQEALRGRPCNSQ